MDLNLITEKLLKPDTSDVSQIKESQTKLVENIRSRNIKVIDLVQSLDPILTNGSHEIRHKGVQFLTQVIILLPKDLLNEKEIKVISEFLCLRIIDHQMMEQPALKCLAYFVDCDNKQSDFNKILLEFIKGKINIRRMDSATRKLIYEITRTIIVDCHDRKMKLNCDFIYPLVHIIEGESHPENLMTCFGIVSYVLKNFSDIEPYIDDLFLWLSSYYPIEYTPNELEGGVDIQRSDLVDALYDCFFATELNSENLQTLLLEKLETNLISTRLESLNCLIKCYEVFPFKTICNYASSLWTFVRVSCLKKAALIEPMLLDTCCNALSALALNLNEDEEYCFKFVCEVYEELSLAFRKPELDLFEPASRLVAHIMQPEIKFFNYVLNNIIPIAQKIISKDEIRPIQGLAYIFKQLAIHHRGSKLSIEPNTLLDGLTVKVLENIGESQECLELLNAMVLFKVEFSERTLNSIIGTLRTNIKETKLDFVESLAYICLNYKKFEILFKDGKIDECDIESLIKSFHLLNKNETSGDSEIEMPTYLRMLIMLLDNANCTDLDNLDPSSINECLYQLRCQAKIHLLNSQLVEQVAKIHAILINKLIESSSKSILMAIITSEFCQNLIPVEQNDGTNLSEKLYLPTLKLILKSLVLKNSQFTVPIINLILNYITSDKVNRKSALAATQSFGFVQDSDDQSLIFETARHYQVFAIHKQKFYFQSSKEIKIRYSKLTDDSTRYLLIASIGSQIPKLPYAIYKKDFDWLLREILKILQHSIPSESGHDKDETLLMVMYECMDSLIREDTSQSSNGLIGTMINLHLDYGTKANTMQVRRRALLCLANMTKLYEKTELLLLRSIVIDRLRHCLADKKRLVRQAAADARLKWTLVGQPVGS